MSRSFTDKQLDAIGAGIKAGEPIEKVLANLPAKPKKKRRNDEWRLQATVFGWWRAHASDFGVDPRLFYSIPNGNLLGVGSERFIRARMLRISGMENGIPDAFLSVVRGGYGGCYIEFKTEKGVVSPEQKQMHSILANAGYQVWVCRSFDSAKEIISNYLNQ